MIISSHSPCSPNLSSNLPSLSVVVSTKKTRGTGCFQFRFVANANAKDLSVLVLPTLWNLVNRVGSSRDSLCLRSPHRIHGTGIFTCICHKNQLNVGEYTIHGSYGHSHSTVRKHAACNVTCFGNQVTGSSPVFPRLHHRFKTKKKTCRIGVGWDYQKPNKKQVLCLKKPRDVCFLNNVSFFCGLL